MTTAWAGEVVRAARRYWAARLPLPCSRCTLDVLSSQAWDVDHLVSRAQGGDVLARDNQWPAHRRCNARAGQALSAERARARRAGRPLAPNRRAWL